MINSEFYCLIEIRNNVVLFSCQMFLAAQKSHEDQNPDLRTATNYLAIVFGNPENMITQSSSSSLRKQMKTNVPNYV